MTIMLHEDRRFTPSRWYDSRLLKQRARQRRYASAVVWLVLTALMAGAWIVKQQFSALP